MSNTHAEITDRDLLSALERDPFHTGLIDASTALDLELIEVCARLDDAWEAAFAGPSVPRGVFA